MEAALTVLIGAAGLALLVVASAGVMLFLRSRSSADVMPRLTEFDARIAELEESWGRYLRRQAGRNRHQKGAPADIEPDDTEPQGAVTGLNFRGTPPGSLPPESDPRARRSRLRSLLMGRNGGNK